MKKVIDSLKYIKLSDLASPFIFIIALPCAIIFRIINKLKKRTLWLVCEDGVSARDNGYFFYKYVREKHPNDYCFYVIDKKSQAFSRVQSLGNIIQYKSFKHWIYYLAAKLNISNQKSGNPNQAFFYVIHVTLGWFNNRVFLQHGITKDLCDWLLYKNTKFRMFICGAKREYDYIKLNYGYPNKNVEYTGFARFDSLHDFSVNKKEILVMPTWRNWLGRETNTLSKKYDFCDSSFYKYWNSFLNSDSLEDILEQNDLTLLFYPHINMQKYLESFKIKSKRIKLVNMDIDIQELLKSSCLLITDYSSVYMDFAYMRKPIIYYQFDIEEYRKKQYVEGYFNYENDGFGPICYDEEALIKSLSKLVKNEFQIEKKYLDREDNFFELSDSKNCERQYKLFKSISKE